MGRSPSASASAASAASRPAANKPAAVVIARLDGQVVAQNGAAHRLLGDHVGRACWALREVEGATNMPCNPGCVGRLLMAGADHAAVTPVALRSVNYDLFCVPVDGKVVCVFAQDESQGDCEGWKRLTPREQDVLRAVADGLTTDDIAKRLGVSSSTIRAHIEHMRTKLDVKTRAALVTHGFRTGYLK